MKIAGGINQKGHIFVNSFNDAGNILTKRLIKNGKQYDYYYENSAKKLGDDCVLITHPKTGKHYVKEAPERYNWFKGILKSIFGDADMNIVKDKNGEKYITYSTLDLDDFYNRSTGENVMGDFYRNVTGYTNKEVDKEQSRLEKFFTRVNPNKDRQTLNISEYVKQ